MKESPFRAFFGWPIRAGRKSLPFLHKNPLIAVIRTWILFRLKVSQLLQLRVLRFEANAQIKTAIRIPPLE